MVVVLFVLDGRDHPDRGVQAAMVEPVDIFCDGELEVVDRSPGAAVADEFGFEERVECLGEGGAVAVAAASDGRDLPCISDRSV